MSFILLQIIIIIPLLLLLALPPQPPPTTEVIIPRSSSSKTTEGRFIEMTYQDKGNPFPSGPETKALLTIIKEGGSNTINAIQSHMRKSRSLLLHHLQHHEQ
jgi:hypothetical protein